MSKQTRFLAGPSFLLSIFLCGSVSVVQAAPATVLAPVVDVKGSASWVGRGSGESGALRGGESLAEGSSIKTGAGSRVMFSPVPGLAVSEAKDTSASLLSLKIVKDGATVQKRDAMMKLEPGMLSFSLGKRDASTTSFAVQTPNGMMNARGSVGTIAVVPPFVKIASLSGRITFTPVAGAAARVSGSNEPTEKIDSVVPVAPGRSTPGSIAVEAGSFLTIGGKSPDARIRLINTIDRTTTSFSTDGTQLSTGDATTAELESSRGYFEATMAHAALAAGYGLLSSDAAAGITETLMKINESFAAVGISLIEASAVGATARAPDSNKSTDTAAPAGFSGGSLNPANTSGEVISRER